MSDVVRPRALLLDFGGVLYTPNRRPTWNEDLAQIIEDVLTRARVDPPSREVIMRDVAVARVAEHGWKTAASRTAHPAEIAEEMFWSEFVASDWSPAARALLGSSAIELSERFTETVSEYTLRPGVRELLDEAHRQGVPAAIVSNTHSGVAFRKVLERDGLLDAFALHVFSNEVGLRKPNPEMLRFAATGLGVPTSACWYAGDHFDRDVMCARRAGIGTAVLIHDISTDAPPFTAQVQSDIEVSSPAELVPHLAAFADTPLESDMTIVTAEPAPSLTLDQRRPSSARPAALLLDHGGVIADSRKSPEGHLAFAGQIVAFLEGTGWREFDVDRVARDIEEALHLHAEMKDPCGTTTVREVGHREFWGDLVAGAWPDHPRAAVTAHADALMFGYVKARSERSLRPGVLDLMARCHEVGIPIGIVSNTLCGAVVRELGVEFGTAPYLGVQIYSDELGVRKPDPAMIEAATAALGVDPGACWYVGDKPNRDLVCGRRAGIGRSVLMRRPDELRRDLEADLIVEDATELLGHLDKTLS